MVCCGSSGVRDVTKYKQKVSRSRSTGMAAVLWVDLQRRAENYGVFSILMGKIGGFTGRNRSRRWAGWLCGFTDGWCWRFRRKQSTLA
jgi:hypothetical protein